MGEVIRLSPEAYHKLIWEVFKRDEYRCRHCGWLGRNLEAHHVIFRSQGGSDVINNLVTLCHWCHSGIHENKLQLIVIDVTEDNVILSFKRKGKWKPR